MCCLGKLCEPAALQVRRHHTELLCSACRLSSLETEKGTTTEVALSRVLGLQHTGGYEQASELASPVDLLHLVGRFQGAEEANNWVYQHTRTLVQWLTQVRVTVLSAIRLKLV